MRPGFRFGVLDFAVGIAFADTQAACLVFPNAKRVAFRDSYELVFCDQTALLLDAIIIR